MHRLTPLTVILTILISTLTWSATEADWIPIAPETGGRSAQARLLSQSLDEITLEIEIAGFHAGTVQTEHGSFSTIEIPGCGRTALVGKATLPVFRRAVEIPQGPEPRLEILEIATSRFDLANLSVPGLIWPVQPPIEKLPGAREAAEFVLSEEFYTSSKPYPAPQARIVETGQMRAHRFAMIEIAPVGYNPAEASIEVVSRMTIRITTPGADHARTRMMIERYRSPDFERLASAVLLNYQRPSAKAVPDWPVGYLIITATAYADEIQPLADWKHTKGYYATVTPTDSIPGGATTTAIKAYIKDAWQNWDIPPSFVLLVGDVADIPNWTGVGVDNPATDLYYGTMTDPDYIPDLGIGRFSVVSPEQVTALVEKTIDYEQALFAGTAWLNKAVFMASEDNYTVTEGTHNYVISTYIDPAGYTSDKLYCHTYSATTQQVRDAFNEGRGLGVYSGHGATTYWADGPQFTQSDVGGLTNIDEYPFVQSYACYTGSYTLGECFAETWIREIDKAGLGFWGSSVTSYWDEDDVLEKGVFKALFEDSLTWISGMTDQGKWYLYEYYGGGGSTQRYYEMYNIMGDPSVDIWTEAPAPMTVSHLGTCPVGATSYAVHVDDGKGPLADALACLNMPQAVYETGYSDVGGDAVLALDPQPSQPGEMMLTMTCHNFIPYFDTVEVFVPATVTIDPDTIPVATSTDVTITVLDTLAQPVADVVVTIDGWGIDPALIDTTDVSGQAVISMDAPYGELLSVIGRKIGETYDYFEEVIVVEGGLTLPAPQVEAGVEEIGLIGALAPGYQGSIVGRTSHTGLDMFAVGCGVDASVSSPADTSLLEVTPTGPGSISVALAYQGYQVYVDQVPVIEAYGMLSGTIRDGVSGDSLPGIDVRAYTSGADTTVTPPAFEITSGFDGTYASPDSMLVGKYDMYATKFGYLDFAGSTMVYWGTNTYDIEMTPAPTGIVSGTVTETGTGKALTATIEIFRSDDMSLYSQTTSDSLSGGAYATDPLPYFTYIFRISAPHYMMANQYVTVDESAEPANFELTPTEGNLLVIDDYTASMAVETKFGPKGEVIRFDGVYAVEKESLKSASLIAQDLTDIGYNVTSETSASTNPAAWPDYDVVIWSSGEDISPVAVAAYRANLNSYVAAGGKLLIEGGEIGYDAAIYPGYPNFVDTTLHVSTWMHDPSGNLSIAMPTHPIASTPNPLPSTLSMTYSDYGDQDALLPDSEAEIVIEWSSYAGQGGVLVYDDNTNPTSSQIVFFSFDYANVTDTTGRADLLENTMAHLLADEAPPTGAVSGRVELSGEVTYGGVIVRTSPMGLQDTTDAAGNYYIGGLYAGTYQVTASKAGFTDSTVTVEVTGGIIDNVDFTLYPVLEYMDSPEIAIPDNDSTGIRVYLDVPADAEIASVDCYVDLTHTFRGDLIIEITSPGGTTVRLHDCSGGTAEDIVTWYDRETEPDGPGTMADFSGEWAEGTWEMWICDVAGNDTGTLHTWGLALAFTPATSHLEVVESEVPKTHFLAQNYPNPFRPSTHLRFGLSSAEEIEIAVYNVRGQRIAVLASGTYGAGIHDVVWDGTDSGGHRVASGIYFCRMRAGDFKASRTMVKGVRSTH